MYLYSASCWLFFIVNDESTTVPISEKVMYPAFSVILTQWKDHEHQTPLKAVIGLFDPSSPAAVLPCSSACELLVQYP
jgi:hypothetical protein